MAALSAILQRLLIERKDEGRCLTADMKPKLFALLAAAGLLAGPAFAGGHACCAGAATAASDKTAAPCASFANLNLTAQQKTKLEAWQAECMQAGCTKQSTAKFLREAKGILSPEQYAAVKKSCSARMGKAS